MSEIPVLMKFVEHPCENGCPCKAECKLGKNNFDLLLLDYMKKLEDERRTRKANRASPLVG